jgi:HSP20 family protein
MEDLAMLPMLRHRTSLPGFVYDVLGKDVFSDFFDDRTGISTPAVNIKEDKDDFKVEVAAPGLNKKDFKINLENNVLTVSCDMEENREEKDERYMRREFCYSSFCRSFALPDSVDSEKIKAEHKDGILSIVIPKREEAKVKPARLINIE